jgi:hypothetical protein
MRYATLSHRWAGTSVLTTRANLASHSAGFERSSLPLMFRQAISVVQQLGLAYLWIDALCIVQDDVSDWASEAARMAETFQASTITFAMTAVTSSDAEVFHIGDDIPAEISFALPHNPSAAQEIVQEYVIARRADALRDIVQAPLNEGAWVLQELVLSRRTLHFARNQLHWHCYELATSEDDSVHSETGELETMGKPSCWACTK